MSAFNINGVLVGLALIICEIAFIFWFLQDLHASQIWKAFVIPINLILFMLMYFSFIKVYFTEPGNVPTLWSVEPEYNDSDKKRKYCLVCKNFKPERAHHCSSCGKCILNMDHHCPWVNNCIGHYNKKFFILFLSYLIANLVLVIPQ